MTAGPTELDPYRVYTRVREALEHATDLRAAADSLVGGRTLPSTLTHRKFRIEPKSGGLSGRGRPGDSIQVKEQVAILLHHDIGAKPESSYEIASRDLILAIRALLTRTELSGLGQPTITGWVWRRAVGHIEGEIALALQYDITLPAAAPETAS